MKELIFDAVGALNVNIDETAAERLLQYMELLLEWNEKINLTAITDRREIILKHFADSLTLMSCCSVADKAIIDVGAGAGFPSLPLKIAEPSVKLTMIDSLNKRVNFLQEVLSRIGLDASCIHTRAEDLAMRPEYRESFDIAVSRAVAGLNILCELCIPFVKVGGFFAAYKGPDASNEISEAKTAIKRLGAEITEIKTINIPFTDIKHTLIFIVKISQTPKKYPRKYNKIIKNPIS